MDYTAYAAACGIKLNCEIVNNAPFAEHLKGKYKGAVTSVLSDEGGQKIADGLAKSLAESGFVVKRRILTCRGRREDLKQVALTEGVKLVVAVGGVGLAGLARLIAAEYGAATVLVPTALDGEGYLAPYVELYADNEVISCPPPDGILFDDNRLFGQESAAEGYGRVLFTALRLIDLRYLSLIRGERVGKAADGLLSDVIDFLNGDYSDGALKDILIKIGVTLNATTLPRNCFANVLTACGGRGLGENSYLAAYITLKLYAAYLKERRTDTLLPPDIIKSLKLLEKTCGLEYNKSLTSLDIPTEDALFKAEYVASEYRDDLLADVLRPDLTKATRTWRRLYRDAGYWVKGYVTAAKLFRLLSLSAELSEGLIKNLKRGGLLENYI